MKRIRILGWVLAGAGLVALAALLLGPGGGESGFEPPGPAASSPPKAGTASPPASRDAEGPSAPAGVPDDYIPPEVLAAAAGRTEDSPPAAGGLPARPEVHVGEDSPRRGPDEREGPPRAGGPGAGPPAFEEDTPEAERKRREAWVEKQRRRNQLRVEAIVSRSGLDEARRAAFSDALESSLAARVELYESIDPKSVDQVALSAGLDRIREAEAARLVEILGRETYEEYRRLDEHGTFVLPEEHQKPR